MMKRDNPLNRWMHAAALLAMLMLTGCQTVGKLGEGLGNMGDKAL
jgi:hypothetical protein